MRRLTETNILSMAKHNEKHEKKHAKKEKKNNNKQVVPKINKVNIDRSPPKLRMPKSWQQWFANYCKWRLNPIEAFQCGLKPPGIPDLDLNSTMTHIFPFKRDFVLTTNEFGEFSVAVIPALRHTIITQNFSFGANSPSNIQLVGARNFAPVHTNGTHNVKKDNTMTSATVWFKVPFSALGSSSPVVGSPSHNIGGVGTIPIVINTAVDKNAGIHLLPKKEDSGSAGEDTDFYYYRVGPDTIFPTVNIAGTVNVTVDTRSTVYIPTQITLWAGTGNKPNVGSDIVIATTSTGFGSVTTSLAFTINSPTMKCIYFTFEQNVTAPQSGYVSMLSVSLQMSNLSGTITNITGTGGGFTLDGPEFLDPEFNESWVTCLGILVNSNQALRNRGGVIVILEQPVDVTEDFNVAAFSYENLKTQARSYSGSFVADGECGAYGRWKNKTYADYTTPVMLKNPELSGHAKNAIFVAGRIPISDPGDGVEAVHVTVVGAAQVASSKLLYNPSAQTSCPPGISGPDFDAMFQELSRKLPCVGPNSSHDTWMKAYAAIDQAVNEVEAVVFNGVKTVGNVVAAGARMGAIVGPALAALAMIL